MNGSEIHWMIDGLIIIIGAFVLCIGVAPCILSSRISREEEDREVRAAVERIKRAA